MKIKILIILVTMAMLAVVFVAAIPASAGGSRMCVMKALARTICTSVGIRKIGISPAVLPGMVPSSGG